MKNGLNIHLVFKVLAMLYMCVYYVSHSGVGLELQWNFIYSFSSQSLCYAMLENSTHTHPASDSKSYVITYPVFRYLFLQLSVSGSSPTLSNSQSILFLGHLAKKDRGFSDIQLPLNVVYFCVSGATLEISGKRKEKKKNNVDCTYFLDKRSSSGSSAQKYNVSLKV